MKHYNLSARKETAYGFMEKDAHRTIDNLNYNCIICLHSRENDKFKNQ